MIGILIGIIIGIPIGWTIGNVIPHEANFPLFMKKVLAYFPCRTIWFYYKRPDYPNAGKIQATMKYREITNVGLLESKNQMERWFE
jgi:hypothetical protein